MRGISSPLAIKVWKVSRDFCGRLAAIASVRVKIDSEKFLLARRLTSLFSIVRPLQ